MAHPCAQSAQIVSVGWIGDQVINVVFRDHNGTVAEAVHYRDDEHRLEVERNGRPWSFDADGALLRLVRSGLPLSLTRHEAPTVGALNE